MKQLIISMILVAALLMAGCNAGGSSSGKAGEANFDKDASYSLGYYTGMDWKNAGIIPDYNEILKGIKDALGTGTPRFDMEEAYMKVNEAYMALQSKISEANMQDEIDFLAQNSQKAGIIITSSGLQYEIISEGRGDKPGPEDTVLVHYEGALSDGVIFESSYENGEPVEIPLPNVMPGWSEGLQLMSEGATYRLFIPSELAYGQYGSGAQIPPYSTLVFKVDLISIVR